MDKKRKSVFWRSLIRKPWRVTAVSSSLAIAVGGLVTAIAFYGWPDWTGIGRGQSVSVTTERDTQGNILKTVETDISEPGKTLWDLLSLVVVPLSLLGLGAWLQQQQQQRAEAASEEQREISANEAREDALQVYFDRLSALLVDKNLLALAAKVYVSDGEMELELQEQLEAARNVIRARTLSILRRFENDVERQSDVIWFLADAEVLSKGKLDLSCTNLRYTDLSHANLSQADFRQANFNRAYLSHTNFRDADLSGADLSGADLSNADLGRANLRNAYLRNANLRHAYLREADLSFADLSDADLFGASLKDADLSDTDLSGTILSHANFDGTRFCYTDLKNAELDGTSLSNAKLCRTMLPANIIEEPDRDCEELGIDPEKGNPAKRMLNFENKVKGPNSNPAAQRTTFRQD